MWSTARQHRWLPNTTRLAVHFATALSIFIGPSRDSLKRNIGTLTSYVGDIWRSCKFLLPMNAADVAQAQTPTSDLNALPESCINGGTELQTACSEILTAAQTYFNVAPGADAASGAAANITQEQIDAYVAQAPAPTTECCASQKACSFSADFCSCDQGVLDFAVQLTANNANAYKSIALAFAQACQYKLFYGPTCPPKDQQAPAIPENKKVCAALPEPIPASQAAPAAPAHDATNPAAGAATARGNATAPAAGNATVPAGAAANGTIPGSTTADGTLPGALRAAAAVNGTPAMRSANLTSNTTTANASEPSAVASGGVPVR